METLCKEGLPVNEDLGKKANELEDVIVKNCRKIQLFEIFEQLLQMRIYPIRFACLFLSLSVQHIICSYDKTNNRYVDK